MWLANEKFSQFDKITFMDITRDKKFGIIGGIVSGEIVVSLFTFDTSMQLVAQTIIQAAEESVSSAVTGIKVSSQRDNLMFVSTRNCLNIVEIDTVTGPNIHIGVVK